MTEMAEVEMKKLGAEGSALYPPSLGRSPDRPMHAQNKNKLNPPNKRGKTEKKNFGEFAGSNWRFYHLSRPFEVKFPSGKQ